MPRRHWLVYGTVLVLGLAIGYGLFAARAGTAAPLPSHAAPRGPVERFEGSAQRGKDTVRSPAPSAPLAQPSAPLAEPAQVAPAEPPAQSKATRPEKRRPRQRISTKNPYR
jgi:hypothetical protein